jgi:hypothetical protein
MSTTPGKLVSRTVLGHDTASFPGVSLAFFSHGDDLVPATRDVGCCGC